MSFIRHGWMGFPSATHEPSSCPVSYGAVLIWGVPSLSLSLPNPPPTSSCLPVCLSGDGWKSDKGVCTSSSLVKRDGRLLLDSPFAAHLREYRRIPCTHQGEKCVSYLKSPISCWPGGSLGWSIVPGTERLQVGFRIRARAWVAGSIPGHGTCNRQPINGSLASAFLSLSTFSFPPSL